VPIDVQTLTLLREHWDDISSVPTLFEQAQLVERNSLVRGLWLLGK